MELERDSSIILPSEYGNMIFEYFTFGSERMLVVKSEKKQKSDKALVRIHSGCIFSEVFKTYDCDCSLQLELALSLIQQNKNAYIFYLFQEGRGKGIQFKMRAIEKQQKENLDTYSAYCSLGSKPDVRDYNIVVAFLKQEKIKKVELITNNPERLSVIRNEGIEVYRSKHIVTPNNNNSEYLREKARVFNHIVNLNNS